MTPFEIFRTPMIIRRFSGGYYLNGVWQEGSNVLLSTVLITGNLVSITYNGVLLTPIPFTTSVSVTMALIKAALLLQPNVAQVDISSNNLQITIVPIVPNVPMVNSFTVTGGASQPTITIANSPTIINATASIQPTSGSEILMLPEARREKETFKFYSSTQIYGINSVVPNQNPDQIEILKAPFTGIIYEVFNINEWQNNSNFEIINHYKFIAMRLAPLP